MSYESTVKVYKKIDRHPDVLKMQPNCIVLQNLAAKTTISLHR